MMTIDSNGKMTEIVMPQEKRVLIMTAVEAERDAVLRGLDGAPKFAVVAGGVGAAAAAASTAKALADAHHHPYDVVVSMGIGGGFAGQAEVGSLAVASEIVAADLGAETPEGFCSVDELGFGSSRVQACGSLAAQVLAALQAAGLPARLGPIVTVTTVTGTAATAARLAARVPGALAEAMEGYGMAIAAELHGLPVLEIRGISNAVGPRDRSAWRIKDALDVLAAASSSIKEVFE